MTETLELEGVGPVELAYTERGSGPTVLLLHGGAGPISVVPWAETFARDGPARVITPTHPGFGGTPRPGSLNSVPGLARLYSAFLDKLGIEEVTVAGNSVGGWIAAEIALLHSRRVRALVIVDAGGIEVPGHPGLDPFSTPLEELSRRSYHDPERFRIDPSKFTPEQRAVMAGNFASLKVYSGAGADPGLRQRLRGIDIPTLVVWGESDRVVDPEYGRAYADAIPGATFQVVPRAGHLPQIESPGELTRIVAPFVASHGARRSP